MSYDPIPAPPAKPKSRLVLGAAAYAKCEPVAAGYNVHGLFDRLQDAMSDGWTAGIGLAAPQIGDLVQAFIIRIPKAEGCAALSLNVWNPKVISQSGLQTFTDGCLSYPKLWTKAMAPMDLEFENGDGKRHALHGFEVCVFTHEMNHLLGINRFKVPEVGRNDQCPCGSGKKFKKCCLP